MEAKEPQSKILMAVVAYFIGGAGIHRLMMGYKNWWMMLVASVLSLGILGWIWSIYDLIMILMGNMKMADGRELV